MVIHINKQLNGKTNIEITPENFPRLFDGEIRVRNISIIENENEIDVQAVTSEMHIKQSIIDFMRKKYQ